MDVNLPVLEEGLRWTMCRVGRADGKEYSWNWPRVEGREEACVDFLGFWMWFFVSADGT